MPKKERETRRQRKREMVSSKSGRSFSTNYGVARSVAGELEIRS